METLAERDTRTPSRAHQAAAVDPALSRAVEQLAKSLTGDLKVLHHGHPRLWEVAGAIVPAIAP